MHRMRLVIGIGLLVWVVGAPAAFCGIADGYAERIAPVSGLIRHYPFDGAAAVQPDRAGSDAAMRFSGGGLRAEPGVSGSASAPRFADAGFEARPVSLTNNAFTFALWLKPLGMGKEGLLDSGILCQCGDGWRQGMRLAVPGWWDLKPTLTLGHAVRGAKAQSDVPLISFVWNQLVATYDGAAARVYVNGRLAAEQHYNQPLVPPTSGLRVGMVGSIEMAVSDVAVFDRALSAAEIASLFLPDAEAGLAAGRLAERCRTEPEAASVPEIERTMAAVRMNTELRRTFETALAEGYGRNGNTEKSDTLFGRLLAEKGLDAEAVSGLRWRFADSLASAGRFDEARRQLERIAQASDRSVDERAFARLALAGSYRQEGELGLARSAYERLASDPALRPHLRQEASELAEECRRVAKGLPARDPLASRHPPADWRAETPAAIFHVAPDGRDEATGERQSPFATLRRAQQAARAARSAAPGKPVWVLLRGGRYRIREPVELTAEDSGAAGAPTVYAAYPGETPVLDGGEAVAPFGRVTDPAVLARLPEAARDHVCVADVAALGPFPPQTRYGSCCFKDSLQCVYDVYQDGEPLQVARWPNDGYEHYVACDNTKHTFTFVSDRVSRWKTADDLMALGWWQYTWAEGAMHVEIAEPAAGVFRIRDDQLRDARNARWRTGSRSTCSTCWRNSTSPANGIWTARQAGSMSGRKRQRTRSPATARRGVFSRAWIVPSSKVRMWLIW